MASETYSKQDYSDDRQGEGWDISKYVLATSNI